MSATGAHLNEMKCVWLTIRFLFGFFQSRGNRASPRQFKLSRRRHLDAHQPHVGSSVCETRQKGCEAPWTFKSIEELGGAVKRGVRCARSFLAGLAALRACSTPTYGPPDSASGTPRQVNPSRSDRGACYT